MIVSREYIPFRTLIEQYDKGGELFIKLCKKSYPRNMWERAYLWLADYALYQREMEWGFSGICELIEGFHKLDQDDPYETGYDLNQACTAEIIQMNEHTMTLLLYTGEENKKAIVGVIEVPINIDKAQA